MFHSFRSGSIVIVFNLDIIKSRHGHFTWTQKFKLDQSKTKLAWIGFGYIHFNQLVIFI